MKKRAKRKKESEQKKESEKKRKSQENERKTTKKTSEFLCSGERCQECFL